MKNHIDMKMQIENPKRKLAGRRDRANWYPYYAGFSTAFAEQLIASAGLKPAAHIVDPWNGSGTTTAAAADCGYTSCGFDLNPAMVVVAKARLISTREKSSLLPLARDIIGKAKSSLREVVEEDPLLAWFVPRSVCAIRALEGAIQRLLVDSIARGPLAESKNVASLSDLAAFFYTALFRTLRSLGFAFAASNPTWMKVASSYRHRLRPDRDSVLATFAREASFMVDAMEDEATCASSDVAVSISVGSSEAIPLAEGSADLILSSPPYCTRLDYAVATRLELALMGYSHETFTKLRRSLIGSVTVEKLIAEPSSLGEPPAAVFWDR